MKRTVMLHKSQPTVGRPLNWTTSPLNAPSLPFLVRVKLPPNPPKSSPPATQSVLPPMATPQKKSLPTSHTTSPSTQSSKIFSSPSITSTVFKSSDPSAVEAPSHVPGIATTTTTTTIKKTIPTSSSTPSFPSNASPVEPSFTSTTLPSALTHSFEKPLPLITPFCSRSLSDLVQFFFLCSNVLCSLYPPKPSPGDVVSTIIDWRDTPTVTGLIIRAAESDIPIGLTGRMQIFYLLGFASKEFSLRIACMLSTVDKKAEELAYWLRVFLKGAEYRMVTGKSESEVLDDEDEMMLANTLMRMISTSSDWEGETVSDLIRIHTVEDPSAVENTVDDPMELQDNFTDSDDDESVDVEAFWQRYRN